MVCYILFNPQPNSPVNSTMPTTAAQGKPKEPSPYAAMMRRKMVRSSSSLKGSLFIEFIPYFALF